MTYFQAARVVSKKCLEYCVPISAEHPKFLKYPLSSAAVLHVDWQIY